MAIKNLIIEGLRGFETRTEFQFALPDFENEGSGLTILVGPNNCGKSTVIEAVHLLLNQTNSVPVNARNLKSKNGIFIKAIDEDEHDILLKSTEHEGAFVTRECQGMKIEYGKNLPKAMILSSKRGFSSTFGNSGNQNRETYIGNMGYDEYRNENNVNHNFGGRLINIYHNKRAFNDCLRKVISPLPKWTIESNGNNNLFLEFSFNGVKHNSNGAGDGYINIFNIVDALYDSNENNAILIDEPEISLHPDLQRKLFKLLLQYSKNRQIIVTTHSPFFVDWKSISNKSKIFRFKKIEDKIRIFELTESIKENIRKLIEDDYNPHILSLNANEIFFLNDNVILTEGQEDVVCYKKIFENYDFHPNASFFGWGAGGASKIESILKILNSLGYDKVFTIIDNDEKEKITSLKSINPNYEFYAILKDDVRDKKDNKIKKLIKKVESEEFTDEEKKKFIEFLKGNDKSKVGMVKDIKTCELNDEEVKEDINKLINSIKTYFLESSSMNNETLIEEDLDQDREENQFNVAHTLLQDYLQKLEINLFSEKMYPKLEIKGGTQGLTSFKDFNNKYYAIIQKQMFLSESSSIVADYYFTIDILKKKVSLSKKVISKNTLPIGKMEKFLKNKLFRLRRIKKKT